MTIRVPMSSPDLTQADVAAVLEVLETGRLSIGPRLAAFEEAVAAYAGAAHGVGVNSGTSGLHLCVIAAGAEAGDLVVTTPFSFIASANCILYERAVPVFVDVDRATGNIDPVQVAEAVEALSRPAGGERWLPPALRGDRPTWTRCWRWPGRTA
jgi:perosamine synthetase